MVKIEVEHGTYEGETLKEAQKLVTLGAKAFERKRKIDDANRKIAYLKAYANGYHALWRLAEKEPKFPNGWRVKLPASKYNSIRTTVDSFGRPWDTAVYEGEDGKAEAEHYRHRIDGIVWNGAGFDIIVFVHDTDTHEAKALAIGIHVDQIAFADIPGLLLEHFERD